MKLMNCICSLVLVVTWTVQADNVTEVISKVDSVGLFKNGLAFVRRQVKVNKTGCYMIRDVPRPVYGTFWIESNGKVIARVTERMVAEPLKDSMTIQDSFAGQEVTIFLKGDKVSSPIKGVLLAAKGKGRKTWDRNYNRDRYGHFYSGYPQPVAGGGNGFFKLRTANGIIMLDRSQIAYISAATCNKTRQVKRPVLILDVNELPGNDATIHISYLTKGMSWAASYLIDLQDKNRLAIEQKAVLKNELMALDNVKVQLISGFPNIKFSHVDSPMSPGTTWSNFFKQLSMQVRSGADITSNVMTQQAVRMNVRGPISRPESTPGIKDGVDIYYHPIGKLSMKEGDSIALSAARQKAEYQKIVLWDIPDNRRADGRYIDEYQRRQNPDKYQNSVWDSIRFKNPFKFPMTTAAATFVEKDRFLGESISYWTNPGEEALVNVNKALSISTKASEVEIPGKRQHIMIFGNRYQESEVKGTLILKNYREKPVKILIKRRFSGELLAADDKPTCELREEGVYSVNKRNELGWELLLRPGKEKQINYSYKVLVDI